jgi:hypothetical protein
MSSTHKQLILALAIAAASGLSPTLAWSADPATKPVVAGGAADGVRITVVGEITAVDAAARTVSIKGPQGNIGDYAVDPSVRNLEQVKVGDRVQLDYRAAVGLALVKGGDGIREKVEADSTATSKDGAKPGGAVLKTTTIVANVLSVDKKRKLVKLQGPEGRVVDVQVRDPKVLKEVKANDQVVAKVTESVAINVKPAAK